jgi:hypothetical protein
MGSPVEYFSVHVLCADGFQFLACLVKEKYKEGFSFLLNILTNSKYCFESRIKFLFRLSYALTGRFFPVYINGLLEKFKVTDGYRKA